MLASIDRAGMRHHHADAGVSRTTGIETPSPVRHFEHVRRGDGLEVAGALEHGQWSPACARARPAARRSL